MFLEASAAGWKSFMELSERCPTLEEGPSASAHGASHTHSSSSPSSPPSLLTSFLGGLTKYVGGMAAAPFAPPLPEDFGVAAAVRRLERLVALTDALGRRVEKAGAGQGARAEVMLKFAGVLKVWGESEPPPSPLSPPLLALHGAMQTLYTCHAQAYQSTQTRLPQPLLYLGRWGEGVRKAGAGVAALGAAVRGTKSRIEDARRLSGAGADAAADAALVFSGYAHDGRQEEQQQQQQQEAGDARAADEAQLQRLEVDFAGACRRLAGDCRRVGELIDQRATVSRSSVHTCICEGNDRLFCCCAQAAVVQFVRDEAALALHSQRQWEEMRKTILGML